MTNNKKKTVARMNKAKYLLANFGLSLIGFDPGVLAITKDGYSISFDGIEWKWLEPLLLELQNYRALTLPNHQAGVLLDRPADLTNNQ